MWQFCCCPEDGDGFAAKQLISITVHGYYAYKVDHNTSREILFKEARDSTSELTQENLDILQTGN